MIIEEKKKKIIEMAKKDPAIVSRIRSMFDGKSAISKTHRQAHLGDEIFKIRMSEENFFRLMNGLIEPTIFTDFIVSPSDQITRFQYVNQIFEVFFYRYNDSALDNRLQNTMIDRIYRRGKIGEGEQEKAIYPWAIPADLGQYLYNFTLEHDLSRSLEIGLAYGLSALFILQAHQDRGYGQHTAIDPGQESNFHGLGLQAIDQAGFGSRFQHLLEPDFSALPKLLAEGKELDFIFVDGLHLFDYVLLDFFYSDLLLKKGGYIAFDDCTQDGVRPVLDFIRKNRQYEEIETPFPRLSVWRKLDLDVRLSSDPSGFTGFIAENSLISDDAQSSDQTIPNHANWSPEIGFDEFVDYYNSLVKKGYLSIRGPWKFEIELNGSGDRKWEVEVSEHGVRILNNKETHPSYEKKKIAA